MTQVRPARLTVTLGAVVLTAAVLQTSVVPILGAIAGASAADGYFGLFTAGMVTTALAVLLVLLPRVAISRGYSL